MFTQPIAACSGRVNYKHIYTTGKKDGNLSDEHPLRWEYAFIEPAHLERVAIPPKKEYCFRSKLLQYTSMSKLVNLVGREI